MEYRPTACATGPDGEPIVMPPEVRNLGTAVIGEAGMGKTSMLERLAVGDARTVGVQLAVLERGCFPVIAASVLDEGRAGALAVTDTNDNTELIGRALDGGFDVLVAADSARIRRAAVTRLTEWAAARRDRDRAVSIIVDDAADVVFELLSAARLARSRDDVWLTVGWSPYGDFFDEALIASLRNLSRLRVEAWMPWLMAQREFRARDPGEFVVTTFATRLRFTARVLASVSPLLAWPGMELPLPAPTWRAVSLP
jgi:hypothetical protein